MNVADMSQKQWELATIPISEVSQFKVVGKCTQIMPEVQFGRDGRIFKFKLSQGEGPKDTIVVAMFNGDIDTFAPSVMTGKTYRITAPKVQQTRKEVRVSNGAAYMRAQSREPRLSLGVRGYASARRTHTTNDPQHVVRQYPLTRTFRTMARAG